MTDTTIQLAEAAQASSSDPWVVIILALITVSGVIITAWFSYLAQKHAKTSAKHSAEANDAVNHRQPGQDRLFDMVASTRDSVKELTEWKEQWDAIPSKYQDPQGLATSFAVIEDRISRLVDKVDNRIMDLRSHIDEKVFELDGKIDEIDDKLTEHIKDSNEKYNQKDKKND